MDYKSKICKEKFKVHSSGIFENLNNRIACSWRCFSSVGRRGGKQLLSLGKGCKYVGVVMHEFMHALGKDTFRFIIIIIIIICILLNVITRSNQRLIECVRQWSIYFY